MASLSSIKRIPLAHLPTPLDPLPALGRELGINLWAKRDDCTGLGTGGNKTRKLEYLLADAVEQKATVLVTMGAVQSNHCRQTAAVAAQHGLKCELLLTRPQHMPPEYFNNGNALLSSMFGANLVPVESEELLASSVAARMKVLTEMGERPYLIPVGGSNAIGALGYAQCAQELLQQCTDRLQADPQAIVLGTGSGGTQAGLLVGLQLLGRLDIKVIGINVSATTERQKNKIRPILKALAEKLLLQPVDDELLICDDRFYGPAYGVPNEGTIEAVNLFARKEGLLLDPVYTGKGANGLIQMARDGCFDASKPVVFLHTGGQSSLFAYASHFNQSLQ